MQLSQILSLLAISYLIKLRSNLECNYLFLTKLPTFWRRNPLTIVSCSQLLSVWQQVKCLLTKSEFAIVHNEIILVVTCKYYSHFRPPAQGERQSFEILYPGEFTDRHPYEGEPTAVSPLWKPHVTAGSNILPIHYLSHVTHNKQAGEIKKAEFLAFKPHPKVGKALGRYDGTPVGETFKPSDEDKFEQIHFREPVYPGQITWWGINMHRMQEIGQGTAFNEALKKGGRYFEVADYLKSEAHSRYGNNEFIVPFHDLMNSYKESRTDCMVKDVYLKLGGTLRYKHEVCYVIIVAMADDNTIKSLKEMPSVYDEECFLHNGCIDEDGKLINEETPSFAIKHIFSESTWETLVFGFYFPKHSYLSLQCPKGFCEEKKIGHTYCISKKPPPGGGKFVCPNYLPSIIIEDY